MEILLMMFLFKHINIVILNSFQPASPVGGDLSATCEIIANRRQIPDQVRDDGF